jgi:hypothetical protein
LGALAVCAPAGAEGPLDRLLVHGNGFVFGVREPPGWHGSIEEAARLSSNVVFYRQGESADAAVALLRIRINDKTGENLDADLQADMDHYRTQYPKVEFRNLTVPHPSYRVVAKLFALPGEWYEYVAYVNPGPGKPWIFGAAMNKQRAEATAEELGVFRKVVASLELLLRRSRASHWRGACEKLCACRAAGRT